MRRPPLLVVLGLAAGCTSTPPSRLRVAADAPPELTCEPADAAALASGDHGVVMAPEPDGSLHALYWLRLPAATQPARGTLFYLAGGPRSHLDYRGMAAGFQKLAYPDLDVVLYDYYGFNCSSALQRVATLEHAARTLTVPAMAADFIALKRRLIGATKAYLMGGSHGAMLGAQIVADYPDDLAKAILFSGDTETGWLTEGWFRYDAIVAGLAAKDAAFAANLDRLFDRASHGQLAVDVHGTRRVVDRPALEVALWLGGGLDSAFQRALPEIVKGAIDGDLDVIEAIYGAELGLLEPIEPTPPPTEVTVVTNFHRCNVWLPASTRADPALTQRHTTYLAYASFAGFWTELCKEYDRLGEFPFHAAPAHPVAVPVLAWIGDLDSFEPDATRARFARLTANLDFEVMAGWSHDFGPDAVAGFHALATKIAAFLR